MAFVLTLYYKQLEYRNDINLHSMFLSLIVILPLLGFATSLFHATLQYEHQLLDKMGMHLLVSYVDYVLTPLLLISSPELTYFSVHLFDHFRYASASVFVRCDPKSWIYHIAMAFSSVLSTAMWLTRNDRHGFPHQFVTRLAITSFSVMFVYIFYGGASMSQKSSKQCESLFDSCYAVWVGSVLFWLMDNFLCDILQNEMTAFIPYLNYHGTAWHLGSCLGCNYLLHVFMGYGLEKQQGVEIQIEWFCVIFPYITIPSQKKKL